MYMYVCICMYIDEDHKGGAEGIAHDVHIHTPLIQIFVLSRRPFRTALTTLVSIRMSVVVVVVSMRVSVVLVRMPESVRFMCMPVSVIFVCMAVSVMFVCMPVSMSTALEIN